MPHIPDFIIAFWRWVKHKQIRIRWALLPLIFLIALLVFYFTASSGLKFFIFEAMYQEKAGLDWTEVVFYHNYLLIVAAFIGLLTVNPLPRHSDLFSLRIAYQQADLSRFFPFFNLFKALLVIALMLLIVVVTRTR